MSKRSRRQTRQLRLSGGWDPLDHNELVAWRKKRKRRADYWKARKQEALRRHRAQSPSHLYAHPSEVRGARLLQGFELGMLSGAAQVDQMSVSMLQAGQSLKSADELGYLGSRGSRGRV